MKPKKRKLRQGNADATSQNPPVGGKANDNTCAHSPCTETARYWHSGISPRPPTLRGEISHPAVGAHPRKPSKRLSRIGHTASEQTLHRDNLRRECSRCVADLVVFKSRKICVMQQLCIFTVCSIRILRLFRRPLDPAVWVRPRRVGFVRRVGGGNGILQRPNMLFDTRRGLKCVQQSLLWPWSCIQFRPVWLCPWHPCQRCGLPFRSMAAITNMLTT
jgi:hypothetical protein